MAELSRAIARLMEEQKRGRVPEPAVPAPVREVVEASRSQVVPGERTLAEPFVRLFAASAGAAGIDERELSALAMVAFRFLMERSADEPRLRVLSPDLAHEGWEAHGTVVQILLRDRPYIVETVRECLHEADVRPRRLLASTFRIERDPRRAVLSIDLPGVVGPRETFVHVEFDRHPEPQLIAGLLTERLRDLILATEDEASMRARLTAIADELRSKPLQRPWNIEAAEAAEFLEWLAEDRFLLLGYREYDITGQGLERYAHVRSGSGLGILQNEDLSRYSQGAPLSEALRQRLHEPPLVMLSKTNAQSPVLRRDYMDYVGVKVIDAAGVVVGERRFLGLYTEKAELQPSSAVPLLRAKLDAVLDAEGTEADTTEGRQLITAFDALPRVETLALAPEGLRAQLRAMLAARDSDRARVEHTPDALDRGVCVLVTVPRERFAREMFGRTEQRLVQATGATAVLYRELVQQDEVVRMHFYLAAPAEMMASFRLDELRGPVLELLRSWEDRLRDELRAAYPSIQRDEIVARYAAALPASYKAHHDIRTAALDIERLEHVRQQRRPELDLADDPQAPGRYAQLKLYHADRNFIVGELVLSLGRLGFGVHEIHTLTVALVGEPELFVLTLRIRDERGPLDVDRIAPLLRPALERLEAGTLVDDELNALLPRAGLDWRQVDALRLCVGYAAQCGAVASRAFARATLVRHPQSAHLLWEYFAAKFDPLDASPPRDRETRTLGEIERRFEESLRSGQNETEVRCLRGLLAVLRAAVRSNYFRLSVSGAGQLDPFAEAPPLALKIDCARLPLLSGRRPSVEIFVSGRQVEGLFARDAAVARGGIGLYAQSDGLRDAVLRELDRQVLRNAPLVPHAAYGGIVPLVFQPSPRRDEDAYLAFVGALLDVTDNVEDGRTRVPAGLVAYDEPDAYLALGPGIGTEAWLEEAGEIAKRRGFWLGHAFAALASRADQHTAADVTARGVWEAVRRHAAELGRNADRDELDVLAIGSLASPELTQALLLSRRLRLRAAFDRRYILLDPNPDPARSFAAREGLADDPTRSWDSLDRTALGDGGGVYLRSSANIPLHPAVRDMLGTERESMSGDELVVALLLWRADLLLSAGGGTFVKASHERHAEARDPEHDAVRVDGDRVGARLVAELCEGVFTQAGRIEYSVAGGRIHSAAVDQSADTQLRDRQVNLEIAVGPTAEGPRLSHAERLGLLATARTRNADLTLRRCRDRVRTLGLDRLRSQTRIEDFADALQFLEADGAMARGAWALPQREALRLRRLQFRGLTHPELSWLSAHVKIALRRTILASSLPDDPFFERYLRGYFPDEVDERCGQGIRSHRLRRNVIAAELANAVVDRMGAGFVARLRRDCGADEEAIVRSWAVAAALSGADTLWDAIADADPELPLAAEARCWEQVAGGVERATRWLLRTQPADAAAAVLYDAFRLPCEEIVTHFDEVLPDTLAANTAATAEDIAANGVPRALAQPAARLQRFAEVLDVAAIAIEHNLGAELAARDYYALCDLLDLEWLDRRVAQLVPEDRWQRRAAHGLSDDLMMLRREITTAVVVGNPDAVDAAAAIESYLITHQASLSRIGEIIDDLTTAPRTTLAGLAVVIRELRRIAREE